MKRLRPVERRAEKRPGNAPGGLARLRSALEAGPFGRRDVPVAEYEAARAAGDLATQRAFWGSLLMRNGVYRTTRANRMDDLLMVIVALLRELPAGPLRALDVACSSGVSTVEMHRAITGAGMACETWGTDLLLNANLVRRDDDWAVLFDHAGEAIRIEHGRWASPWRLRPRDRLLHPGLFAGARHLLDSELEAFRSALQAPRTGYAASGVSLLSSLGDGLPGIHFAEEDLRTPVVPGPFGLIRAANILNLDYFNDAMLRAMAGALCARLVPGGLLVVCRSEGEAQFNRATMFRWTGERLEVEAATNGGSEVTDLLRS